MVRRCAIPIVCFVLFVSCATDREGKRVQYPVHRPPLVPSALLPLPPGAVRAQGWLLTQLELQRDGLTGHLPEVFPDVGPNSAWLGGTGEDWERGPYYVRGLVALAYVLDDEVLKEKAKPWIDWTLGSVREDGNFGPTTNLDWWPRMIMLQALQTYYEATGDPRVLRLMGDYFEYQLRELPNRPLSGWSASRGGENIQAIFWYRNHTPEVPVEGDEQLLSLADLLHSQTKVDYRDAEWAEEFMGSVPVYGHGVNLAQAVKFPALWYQRTGEERYLAASYQGIENLTRNYGRTDGLFHSDEHVSREKWQAAGPGADRGAELCAIVEFMKSLETLLAVRNDPALADRLERVAFNALPAALSPDLRGYQYYSQPNQVQCTKGNHGFIQDHGDDLMFGPLTGYPCCACNLHMGWPLLVKHLWMATPDGGLATVVYGPSEVTARVAGGKTVTWTMETEYPFSGYVKMKLHTGAKRLRFPLYLRIPQWALGAQLRVNGRLVGLPEAGSYTAIDKEWEDGDWVSLEMPMYILASRWDSQSVSIEQGPLVFVLAIDEKWNRMGGSDAFPHYEILPESPWAYALQVDPGDPTGDVRLFRKEVTGQPWTQESAPVMLKAMAAPVPGWTLDDNGNAGPVPMSPVGLENPGLEEVTLLPYGCTRLRIAYMPVVASP